MSVLLLQTDVDPNDTGFSFGTNGNAVRLINLYGNFRGTGDAGELNFINQSFDIGEWDRPHYCQRNVITCMALARCTQMLPEWSTSGLRVQP